MAHHEVWCRKQAKLSLLMDHKTNCPGCHLNNQCDQGLGAALDVLLYNMGMEFPNIDEKNPAVCVDKEDCSCTGCSHDELNPTTARSEAPQAEEPSRVERKRLTEKARRAEMNERLDELAQACISIIILPFLVVHTLLEITSALLIQVLDEVELPPNSGEGGGKRRRCEGSSTGKCCGGAFADCSGLEVARATGKETQRTALLARAAEQLKCLRLAYDRRTSEVMRLAVELQAAKAAAPLHPTAPSVKSAPSAVLSAAPAAAQIQGAAGHNEMMMMAMPIWVPKVSKKSPPHTHTHF